MTANVVNQVAFLRTSREWPQDVKRLTEELDKAYIDIANTVNSRTIGIFPVNRPAITGNSWFLTSKRQQTLRQVYTFTAAGSIPHGINTAEIDGFVAIYGTFTDGSIWYPLPYVSAVAAANQVSIGVTSNNIVIVAGGGAPAITKGRVVLEWLSLP